MRQARLLRLLFGKNEPKTQILGIFNKTNIQQSRSFTRHFTTKKSLFQSKVDDGNILAKYKVLSRTLFRKGHEYIRSRNLSTITSSVAVGNGGSVVMQMNPYQVADGKNKKIAVWLFGCSAWVFAMVVIGGVTRLTRSGLSMTDWTFTGSLPPITEEAWLEEFDKYKQSPEYKRVNKGMSLEDFKFIYWMEYAHRMWGRVLGGLFLVPCLYFGAKGYFSRSLQLRLAIFGTMGAAQGLIGWWMVKSGLQEPESEYIEPRVSPYRLAAHLTSAFVIYGGLLWTSMSVAFAEAPYGCLQEVQGAAKVRRIALPVSMLVALTAFSGAFVAGNDAGRAFNSFPKMGDQWIPDGLFDLKPLIRNFFENTATVQLDHRLLATATLLLVGGMWLLSRKANVHPAVRVVLNGILGATALQVTLGITTLLNYVPVGLGAAHQAGALLLLTLMLRLLHITRPPSPAFVKILSK